MIPVYLTNFAATVCDVNANNSSFLGFPHWYKYLPGVLDANNVCIPRIESVSDFWLILAAILDMLLRFAALAAVGILVYGGIKYITSSGEPDKTKQARETIFDALIGLGIAVVATAVVSFVAGRFN